MAPVAIVPRFHCHTSAHAPYVTRRQPEAAWPAQDHVCKVQLAFYLNSCRISNLPRAFPLPSRSLSVYPLSIYNTYLESYEFQEEVPVQSFPSGQAVIRFNGHNPCEEYLTWQIFLSGPNYSSFRNMRGRGQEVAKVQVNVAVSKSFFWQALVHDPSTVLRALAISLEIGKPLSIELLDANTVVYQTFGSRGPKKLPRRQTIVTELILSLFDRYRQKWPSHLPLHVLFPMSFSRHHHMALRSTNKSFGPTSRT